MTSVERARKFIQAKGKAIALTIVPLATLTLGATQQANATVIQVLTFGSSPCTVGGSFGATGSCLDTPIAGQLNGANSLKLTGQGSETISEGSFASMNFNWSGGSANGSDSHVIPLTWDFTVTDNRSLATSGGYSLTFTFLGAGGFTVTEPGTLNFVSCGGSGSCATVVGSDNKNSFTGTVTGWSASLNVNASVRTGDTFAVNIPSNSIDVNPSSTPEPGSIVLGATGLLGLMFARFRRRKV